MLTCRCEGVTANHALVQALTTRRLREIAAALEEDHACDLLHYYVRTRNAQPQIAKQPA